MKELGPAGFSAATGLSVKALRLYDERGLLAPARVDRATGYRRYTEDQIATAGRIALLRRAGIQVTPQLVAADSPAVHALVGELAPYQAPVPKPTPLQQLSQGRRSGVAGQRRPRRSSRPQRSTR